MSLCTHGIAQAASLQALADEDLSEVAGRDGLAFNLRGFQMNGPMTLTYTSPDAGNPSMWMGNFWLSRSDDPDATFSDPYRLNIYSRVGMSDVIELSNPLNDNGMLKWQFAADFGVQANGTTFHGGTFILRDLVYQGGGLSITTPADPHVQGIAFGMAMHVDIGNLIIRPRGRDDITVEDSATVADQLNFKGIHISDADDFGKTWVIADVTHQPGIFNAMTDADGSYLHMGIDWSNSPNGAPKGRLVIDDISFKSTDALGNVSTMSLGASRINSIQIQYLDVKFR
ncbi:MAG: hypothetical protein QM749_00935 [Aquabacterium sp.]